MVCDQNKPNGGKKNQNLFRSATLEIRGFVHLMAFGFKENKCSRPLEIFAIAVAKPCTRALRLGILNLRVSLRTSSIGETISSWSFV